MVILVNQKLSWAFERPDAKTPLPAWRRGGCQMAEDDRNGGLGCPEISSEMADAGAWALRTSGVGLLQAESWEVLQVAREVYLAMCSARQAETKTHE